MSTEIKGQKPTFVGSNPCQVRLARSANGQTIAVSISQPVDLRLFADVVVNVADLLPALASELGVIVIDRADLPKVERAEDGCMVITGTSRHATGDADYHERLARENLAAAEYMRAHPKVDEGAVRFFTDALTHLGVSDAGYVARQLVAHAGALAPEAGVRVAEVEGR